MSYQNYEVWKKTPLESPPHLSIIIPAYNEAERIVPTVGAIASHVSDLGFPWELIVADDGSRPTGFDGREVRRGVLATVVSAVDSNGSDLRGSSAFLATAGIILREFTRSEPFAPIISVGEVGIVLSIPLLPCRVLSHGKRDFRSAQYFV